MAVYDGNNFSLTRGGSAVPNIVSVNVPESTWASIQTTTTDSTVGAHTQRQGLKQLGTLDVSCYYDGTAHDAINDDGTATYVATLSSADGSSTIGSWTFDGFTSSFTINGNETDNNVTCDFSIQPIGDYT